MAHTSSAKTPVTPRLYLLGAFRLEIGKQPIRLPTRKVESLLAFLALSPQPHTREKLAALLWGDFTDEQARHSLRTALATLRKELRGDTLLADRETVQLNPDCPLWVDAREFEQTVSNNPQSAVELYQGDLLTDFYDDWILQERERLRLLYIDTLLRLAQQARSHSEYARAIEFAQKVLAADPADEKAYQHIIFCHAVMGDRIGALKQYDECEKKLRDELGVEPSRETVALRDRIEQELTGGKSREALFTNVPVPLTSFVGRQLEMAEVKRLLETTRLLTLTGAGGCGKTRLAIQIATDLAHANRFKNGVWWVDLAALSNPALVPQTVANVFDLRESPQAPLIAILINYFRAKELLLVLDNCEHLIEACARLTETLLSACPQLRILMTSREALNIAGETTYRVPSLSLPDPQRLSPLPALTQYEAVRLFIERAVAVQPAFSVTNANAPAVAQICQHLDGIPLAIELAAARIRALSPDQIAARLDDRFNLLTGGSRTALPRHQTLRAAMDWSYDLLSESERVLLQRLSVFAGGWTLEAAEAVCAEENASLLDVLTSLIDKSLVVVEEKDVEMRYRLLEMIRQYTHEKLHESGESQAVRDRHLEYFLSLAEEGEPYVKSG
jgi:predicted ATPase/DNA-binding SARP family transcriptional activator